MPDNNSNTMVGLEAARMALTLGEALMKLILEAFADGDPAKLQKVTDILPKGDPLKSEAALALQLEIALRGLTPPAHK